jgi:hypothetical protein
MFSVVIVLVARYLAAGERLKLTDFVRETLTASPCLYRGQTTKQITQHALALDYRWSRHRRARRDLR